MSSLRTLLVNQKRMDSLDFLTDKWKEYCSGINILAATGIATLSYFALSYSHRYIWTPFKLYYLAQVLPGVNLMSHGEWAVVTGATDGIGKGYAKAFAKRGLNLVLISRSKEKLGKVENEIRSKFNVKVKTVAADFSKTDIYPGIAQELDGLDIGVLVNNVGMGNAFKLFLDVSNPQVTYTDMIAVNCTAVTQMCAIVLPRMVAKNKGVIVNISSIAAVQGGVTLTVYGPTKRFVSFLTESLRRTYACQNIHGIIFHCLEPGMVETNMLREVKVKLDSESIRKFLSSYTVDVDSYVTSSLNTIGWTDNANGCFTHWKFERLRDMQSKSASDNVTYDLITQQEAQIESEKRDNKKEN